VLQQQKKTIGDVVPTQREQCTEGVGKHWSDDLYIIHAIDLLGDIVFVFSPVPSWVAEGGIDHEEDGLHERQWRDQLENVREEREKGGSGNCWTKVEWEAELVRGEMDEAYLVRQVGGLLHRLRKPSAKVAEKGVQLRLFCSSSRSRPSYERRDIRGVRQLAK
jgi:hypothetical protein